jgi:hypothetical protein
VRDLRLPMLVCARSAGSSAGSQCVPVKHGITAASSTAVYALPLINLARISLNFSAGKSILCRRT